MDFYARPSVSSIIDRTGITPQLPDAGGFVLRSIFVNYRRNDSEGEAGRLFDELAKVFGENAVFMDVAGIEPGQDFRKAIDQSVAGCSVLLGVIGPHWLDSQDDSGRRRLDDAGDFVRIELASALRSRTPVMPVLVRDARMPRAAELPDDLKDLAYRNAVELTHARWKSDIQLLIKAIRPYMDPPAESVETSNVADHPPAEKQASPVSGRKVETESAPVSFDGAEIERVTRELARHLGPIANVMVKRIAQRSTSMTELCAALSREIASDSDRAAFLRACRG
ncbi:MAG TPA: toll/interleukin-1 receptor domain-containing protein [Terracidiphilus sp.]